MADARDAGSPGGTATQFLPASTSDAEGTALASTTGFPNAIASRVLLGTDPIAPGPRLRPPPDAGTERSSTGPRGSAPRPRGGRGGGGPRRTCASPHP